VAAFSAGELAAVTLTAFVADEPAHADAAEHVVGEVIVLVQEMNVVGGDDAAA